MAYRDLRDFIAKLEREGELKRVRAEVDPILEITEIADRANRAGGPALLFERTEGISISTSDQHAGQRAANEFGARSK